MKVFLLAVTIAFVAMASSCSTQKRNETSSVTYLGLKVPPPPLVIYKTKEDYSNLVPLQLSEDKKRVISYPAPGFHRNLFNQGHPTHLKNGLLCDNIGITQHTVYLKYTFEEWEQMGSIDIEKIFPKDVAIWEPFE